MAPSNVAHTPLFIGFVPSLVCALVNHMLCCLCNKHTTCPFCSTTTTQQPATGAATTPPAAPTHTTPQHHQSSTSWPLCRPAHHQVMPRPATLLRFNNTRLSGHLLLSTHHQVCVMASPHTTQHNPAPQACASVGVCGALWLVSTHILFVLASPHHKHRVLAHQCATHTPTAPQHTQLGVVHHAMQPHHTHGCGGCVWCSGGCVGWLAQPPSLLVMPSMWCAAPVSSHHNLVPSSTHTHCAIHTTTTTTAPFGATLATTTSPQTMPINHTHGVWCVVCCVLHMNKDNHTNMVVIGWHETTTMRHTMHHNNQHVGQCDGLEAKAQNGGVCEVVVGEGGNKAAGGCGGQSNQSQQQRDKGVVVVSIVWHTQHNTRQWNVWWWSNA